jgi:tRNA pseudouridine38-40 synthase
MARYRAILAYDGTAYNGYQRQAGNIPTVQAKVENALFNILHTPASTIAAGRTDTGVHATGQVIAFDAEWQHGTDKLLLAINAKLPIDIAVQSLDVATDHFHPRYDALSRTYRYTVAECPVRQPLLNKRAWQMHQSLDDVQMQVAAQVLLGKHDFAALGKPPKGNNTVREIFESHWTVEAQPYGRQLVYQVTATAFLYHMVRRTVAILVEVGLGRKSPDDVQAILHAKQLLPAQRIAPPDGLVLTDVAYAKANNTQEQWAV